MPARHLPVHPNIAQLRNQARDLHRSILSLEGEALSDLTLFHPKPPNPVKAKLADAQCALARSYGVSSWPRLATACCMVDAIWNDDLSTIRMLLARHPQLLHENALGTANSNWGPPLSYAANLGRLELIDYLLSEGAKDHEYAIGRALLQGQIEAAELIARRSGISSAPEGALAGPAYTLSVSGTEFALKMGAKVVAEDGSRLAPVDVVLETDSRKPLEKHAILETYVREGLILPDTPPMAIHRGRLDLLEKHLRQDRSLLSRRFTHEEIYPPELGCHDEVLATHGTPLAGATLLHMCIDYDEYEIACWLIEKGMDINIRASIDPDGFGGHTPLFSAVVSQVNFWINHQRRTDDARYAALLLDHGANPSVRASLRKQLHPGYGEHSLIEYPDVTPTEWGRQFEDSRFVSQESISLIERSTQIQPATGAESP